MRHWRTLAPMQRQHYVPGDHRFLFDQPYVIDTANIISAILNDNPNSKEAESSCSSVDELVLSN